jgi:uncharacterized repeat protein (TIGR04076 family)
MQGGHGPPFKDLMEDKEVPKALKRFGELVGYTEADLEQFQAGDPRLRQMERLGRAAARYAIAAEVVKARNCNSGNQEGDKFILDVDGNFLPKFCPPRLCVYAMSQLAVPVALINERLSEGLDPNQFHFMHQVRCLDVGVQCGGYGEVRFEVKVVPRQKDSKPRP